MRWLFIFSFLMLSGCKETILHDLTEGEGNRLLTRLHQEGITAEKHLQSDGSWALSVARKDAISALSSLSNARVFRRMDTTRSELASGMLPTRETQRFQYERALASDIESTLMALNGVLESRVHLNLPPTDPIFGRTTEEDSGFSGSVLLITDQGFQERHEDIQVLVAAAAGLNPENIAVLISGTDSRELSVPSAKSQNIPISLESIDETSENGKVVAEPIELSTSFIPVQEFGGRKDEYQKPVRNERQPSESEQPLLSRGLLIGMSIPIILFLIGLYWFRYHKRAHWRKRVMHRRRTDTEEQKGEGMLRSGGAS